jgi:hypothetical protein
MICKFLSFDLVPEEAKDPDQRLAEMLRTSGDQRPHGDPPDLIRSNARAISDQVA